MEFNWMAVVAAVAPLVTGFLASLYVGWRAKVKADEIQDWQDGVVDFVDGLLADVEDKKGE